MLPPMPSRAQRIRSAPLLLLVCPSSYAPAPPRLPALSPRVAHTNMPGLVSDVTRIWELNVHWAFGSQCGVWDAKARGVEIWECIRTREYIVSCVDWSMRCSQRLADVAQPGSAPPNPRFWRYVTRR